MLAPHPILELAVLRFDDQSIVKVESYWIKSYQTISSISYVTIVVTHLQQIHKALILFVHLVANGTYAND